MDKIAIDLLWVRPGEVGGTEFYIKNLLDGFCRLTGNFCFVLLVAKDNYDTFSKYKSDKRFIVLRADIKSCNITKRIIWQNLHQNKFLKRNGIKKCFEPVYCKPWFNGCIEYICVIHDLQALHYPHYHPFHEVLFSRMCWRFDIWNAKRIITISEWVKKDILYRYNRNEKEIKVIYNPVQAKKEDVIPFVVIKEKYGIEEKQFYYTVSQLIPHKNLKTLLDVMVKIKKEQPGMPDKLLISGVNGNAAGELKTLILNKGLTNNVILTGFIDDKERNTLYQASNAFLYPSVFEGFGMPPIEAMMLGNVVITTSCTSIREVTQNKANYVKDPYDVNEWISKMKSPQNLSDQMDFDRYNPEKISKMYLEYLTDNFK